MTDHFVDDGAGGSNDGTSWTDAWTAFGSATGISAGDRVFIASTHNESVAGATHAWAGTALNPVQFISSSAGSSPADSTPGAIISWTSSLTWTGYWIADGIEFRATGEWEWAGASATLSCSAEFINCTIRKNAGTGAIVVGRSFINGVELDHYKLQNCTIEWASSAPGFSGWLVGGATLEWLDCTIVNPNSSAPTQLFDFDSVGRYGGNITCYGCDLSAHPTSQAIIDIDHIGGNGKFAHFLSCEIAASATLTSGTIEDHASLVKVRFHLCEDGTDSDPAHQLLDMSAHGEEELSTSIYKVGGASDGVRTNPYSIGITPITSKTAKFAVYYQTKWFPAWVEGDGTSLDFDIHIAHAGAGSGASSALQDDEIWVEMMMPGDSDSSQAQFLDNRRGIAAAGPTTHASDGSTWVGSLANKQRLRITASPDKEGPIQFRICYATGGTTPVYFDPQVIIS